MVSVISEMRADDLRELNLRIGQTEALLNGLRAERDRQLDAVEQRVAGTPEQSDQFELLLDQLTADRLGWTLAQVRSARRQREQRDADFEQRRQDEASEPARDYAE